ncbi:OmpA family protein [Pedobacter jeongneungensis]|uniref:OmpA family protein n=1 Tax=Pedobacter jeongneungensis TaxID=947309 RepID=UPI000468A3A4|nr:OmpA family protein [Pedobacter jeongneungensis]
MAKGIKKIIWTGEGKVYNANKGSIPGQLVVVAPDQYVWFKIGEWQAGTTEQDKKKDIKWAVFNEKSIIDLQKTIPSHFSYGYRIPRRLCGPYLWYIEATWSGNFDSKSGLKIRGESPAKIVDSRWTQNEGGADVRKTYQFSYGELIWLRLFTEGLNGYDNVEVRVFRKLRSAMGLWPKDDEVTRKIYRVSVINGEINLKIPNTYAWYHSMNDRSDVEEFYVRVVHPVTGKYIEDTGGKGDTAHARFLRIKDKLKSQVVEPPQNRTPVTIYQPDKNEARFELCKFEQINVTEAGAKPVLIFDNGKGVKNISDKRETTLESIYFKFDSTELLPASLKQLNNILQFLLEHRHSIIQLDGFACVIGKQNHNNVLSENRAKTVREFFIKGKLDPNRIKTAGHGEVNPTDDKMGRDNIKYKNEYDYTNNRRVDIAFEYYGHNAHTIIYQTISGSTPKNILIQPVNFDTKACFDRKKHDKTITLFNLNEQKAKNEGSITIPAVSSMGRTGIMPLDYLWPTHKATLRGIYSSANEYLVHIHSCRYFSVRNNPTVNVQVYPDVEWTLEFSYNFVNSAAYTHANLPEYSRNNPKPDEVKEIIRENRKAQSKAVSSGMESKRIQNSPEMLTKFELKLQAEWNAKQSKSELGTEFGKKIRKVLDVFIKYKEIADKVKDTVGGAVKKIPGKPPFMFEVQSPALNAAISWNLQKGEGVNVGKIATVGKLNFKGDPLIGAQFVIDLLAVGSRMHPLVAAMITGTELLLSQLNGGITFEAKFYGKLSFDFNALEINSLTGIKAGSLDLGAEMGVEITIKISFAVKYKSWFMEVEVKLRAQGAAKAYFAAKLKIDSDEKGVFYKPELGFSGLIFTFEAEIVVGVYKRMLKFSNDKEPFLKADVPNLTNQYILP